jgi:hypothetical protein
MTVDHEGDLTTHHHLTRLRIPVFLAFWTPEPQDPSPHYFPQGSGELKVMD